MTTGKNSTLQFPRKDEEFYIGWKARAPTGIARFLRRYILLMMIFIITLGLLLAISQKRFSTSTFEYGTLTDVKGIYLQQPVPLIKVIAGRNMFGQLIYISIPLVGYGKHGAEGIINALEKEKKISLHQKSVILRGTLIYHDGKTILQIDEHDQPLVSVSENIVGADLLTVQHDLGKQTLKGEIIDPKCYFGVMKPGEGKPHRDCAVRCISGGIPPLLAVTNAKGEANYYLIAGAGGKKINEQLLDFVAEPVELKAKAVQVDDWIILYIEGRQDIHKISRLQIVRPDAELLACSSSK